MTATYRALANFTVTTNTATITFSSIPNTFRDLVLVIEGTVTTPANKIIRFNSDSGSNYPWIYMSANGSTPSGSTNTSTSVLTEAIAAMNVSEKLFTRIDIMDYSATDKHKICLIRGGRSGAGIDGIVCRWANTSSAISTISCSLNNSASYQSGTTFALYGIVS